MADRGRVVGQGGGGVEVLARGRVFRVAKKWKLLREFPEITLLKVRQMKFDFLDFDEAERLLAAAAEHAPQWHPYVVVAMRTGLRLGELGALSWRESVDLERGRLRVVSSWCSWSRR